MPKFRTQYDPYDKRLSPAIECKDPSRTDQSEAENADINVMMHKFKVSGQPPAVAAYMPTYGDFTGITSFTEARAAILKAEDAFMTLPPDLRQMLGHDPQNFLLYIQNPENKADLVKRGFMRPDDPAPQGGIGGVAPDAKPVGDAKPSAAPVSQSAST